MVPSCLQCRLILWHPSCASLGLSAAPLWLPVRYVPPSAPCCSVHRPASPPFAEGPGLEVPAHESFPQLIDRVTLKMPSLLQAADKLHNVSSSVPPLCGPLSCTALDRSPSCACEQGGGLLASLIAMGIQTVDKVEALLRVTAPASDGRPSCHGHLFEVEKVPTALRLGLRAAMLANLRQVVAAETAEAQGLISRSTMRAKADMPAVRAAVYGSIPAIAAGRSRWLSSDQAWRPSFKSWCPCGGCWKHSKCDCLTLLTCLSCQQDLLSSPAAACLLSLSVSGC